MKKIRRTKIIKRTTTEFIVADSSRTQDPERQTCPLCGHSLLPGSNQNILPPPGSAEIVIDIEPIDSAELSDTLTKHRCRKRSATSKDINKISSV